MFLFNDLLYFRQILLYIGVCDFVVCQVACQILVVSGHVDQAVTGQVEQDRTWIAFDFSLLCFANSGSDSVGRFGCRYNAFALSE